MKVVKLPCQAGRLLPCHELQILTIIIPFSGFILPSVPNWAWTANFKCESGKAISFSHTSLVSLEVEIQCEVGVESQGKYLGPVVWTRRGSVLKHPSRGIPLQLTQWGCITSIIAWRVHQHVTV